MTLCRPIALEQIRAATDGFSNGRWLASGGFGDVFRGSDKETGEEWAVKVAIGHATERAFRNEIERVARCCHPNICRLIGYCSERGEQILVYALAANGSLGSKLRDYGARARLTLERRLAIARGIARALKYLHKEARKPFEFVHLDVKSDNVLLDGDMEALLADFGSLKLLLPHLTSATGLVVSLGYTELESQLTGHATAACDVYSFGVVLLELVTGEPAVLQRRQSRLLASSSVKNQLFLAKWARDQGLEAEMEGAWDPALPTCPHNCVRALYALGLQCVSLDRKARPDIGQVLCDLECIAAEAQANPAQGSPVAAAAAAGGNPWTSVNAASLTFVHSRAEELFHEGKYAEAEEVYLRALHGRELILGDAHPDTLATVHGLAELMWYSRRTPDAEALFRRAMAGREAALGPAHSETLASASFLAAAIGPLGYFAEAEELGKRALAGLESSMGESRWETLQAVSNLAEVEYSKEGYVEAERLFRRALVGREAVLGATAVDTLQSLHDLAVTLHSQGRLEESEELQRRALAGRESTQGAAHPRTLESIRSLGVLMRDWERHREAEELFRRALAAEEATLGATHPDILRSMDELALTMQMQGRSPL